MKEQIIHSQRHCGEFEILYTWVDTAQQEKEPAMLLRKGKYATTTRRRAVVIPLSQAHMMAGAKSGAPTPHLVMASVEYADHLGLAVTQHTCRKIADAIVDGLPDLVGMPPYPSSVEKEEFERRGPTVEGQIDTGDGQSFEFVA